MRMYNLMNFCSALIFWYKTSAEDVKKYFHHYLKLCGEKNVNSLSPQDFFTPNDIPNGQTTTSTSFNYSRFFYEIGINMDQNMLECLSQRPDKLD